jgi:SAM-dependent methyltransferase
MMKKENIRKAVREGYAEVARSGTGCCGPQASCCGGTADSISQKMGYSAKELKAAPEGANLGLGCGNPVALASLKKGESVLDLGAGPGLDCFLAARRVGQRGHVIGVDMTPEMIEKARENARKGKYRNIEFRLGEIEHLPVADASVDVIISNCVINLAPDKRQVFREAFRVLKPGGRLMVSDIVLRRPLPAVVRKSVAGYVGCLSGAVKKADYLDAIKLAGFRSVQENRDTTGFRGENGSVPIFTIELMANDPTAKTLIRGIGLSSVSVRRLSQAVASVNVLAIKPGSRRGGRAILAGSLTGRPRWRRAGGSGHHDKLLAEPDTTGFNPQQVDAAGEFTQIKGARTPGGGRQRQLP